MSHARSKVYASYEDDDQRNVPQSEIDELAKRSGKNIRGYMPSVSSPRSPASHPLPPAPKTPTHMELRRSENQMDQVNRLEEEMVEQRRAEAMKRDPTLHVRFPLSRPPSSGPVSH